MSRLQPEKLHVQFVRSVTAKGPVIPRRYTLTHSDVTGDLFLTIGPDYNREQISSLYTRLLRDEVLAEWKESPDGLSLHVYCHVSGGFILLEERSGVKQFFVAKCHLSSKLFDTVTAAFLKLIRNLTNHPFSCISEHPKQETKLNNGEPSLTTW